MFWFKEDGTIKTYELEKYNIDLVLPGRLLFTQYEKTKDNRYLVAMENTKKTIGRTTKNFNRWILAQTNLHQPNVA